MMIVLLTASHIKDADYTESDHPYTMLMIMSHIDQIYMMPIMNIDRITRWTLKLSHQPLKLQRNVDHAHVQLILASIAHSRVS
jgi:hypothetical protein